MATVNVFTAERMQEIQDNTIVSAEIIDGHLWLHKYDDSLLDVGPVGDGGTGGAVISVNGRVGAVTGLTEDAVTLDIGTRLIAIEALGPLASESQLDDAVAAIETAMALLIPLTQKGAINGVASLDGTGKILSAQLPSIAVVDVNIVASQAAMLALPAQKGDVAVRTDVSQTFMLSTNSPGTLADWKELLFPPGAVSSVNGRTGPVTGLAEQTSVDLKADDNAVVKLTGVQTVAGNKRFNDRIGINIDPGTRVGIGTKISDLTAIDIFGALVVKPLSDIQAGIVIKIPSTTYAEGANDNYGTFPFMIVDTNVSETIMANAIRFYITANGSPQAQGWMHICTGAADPTMNGETPHSALWVQPQVDIIPLTLSQPTAGTKNVMYVCNSAGTVVYFKITPSGGTVIGPGGLAVESAISADGSISSDLWVQAGVGLAGFQVTIGDTGGSKPGIAFGTGVDSLIYKNATGSIVSNADFNARFGAATQVGIGAFFGAAGLWFGSAFDASVYRTAADTLTTGNLVLNEAKNLSFGTTTGTKIGTATGQKLAFWNKTPIVQPTALPAAATDLATALTLVNDIRTKLTSLGLVA